MSINICLAQTADELDFILKKVNEPVKVVSLDLSVFLYCVENKIDYYDPINLINRNFHFKIITESDRLIKNINFGNLEYDALRKEFASTIRLRFYNALFLLEVVNKINNQEKINKIYTSGWNKYTKEYSKENYFLSYLAKELFKHFNVQELSSEIISTKKNKYFEYYLNLKSISNKKTIILSNLGYNFSRILFHAIKKGYKVILFTGEASKDFSLIKKLFFLFLGVQFIKFKKSGKTIENQIVIPNINFKSENISFSKILNDRKNEELNKLNTLNSKRKALENFFNKNEKISMIFTYAARGIGGLMVEAGKNKSIPSICIHHGTIAKSFNNFDKIYKKINADKSFSGKAKYFAIQSKITKDSLITHKIEGEPIETGNILFQEAERKSPFFIMYAVTLKNFDNLSFLGDEMFYEFIENLKLFENFAKKYKLKFLIKLHPSAARHIGLLQKNFKNLKFTISNLKKNLQKCLLTISYSSTVIEDSLYCRVPVILFDKWQRFKHCDSQLDPKVPNEAMYYVTNEDDLLTAINSIKVSDKFNFTKYIYLNKYTENINKLFKLID